MFDIIGAIHNPIPAGRTSAKRCASPPQPGVHFNGLNSRIRPCLSGVDECQCVDGGTRVGAQKVPQFGTVLRNDGCACVLVGMVNDKSSKPRRLMISRPSSTNPLRNTPPSRIAQTATSLRRGCIGQSINPRMGSQHSVHGFSLRIGSGVCHSASLSTCGIPPIGSALGRSC